MKHNLSKSEKHVHLEICEMSLPLAANCFVGNFELSKKIRIKSAVCKALLFDTASFHKLFNAKGQSDSNVKRYFTLNIRAVHFYII